MTVATEDTTPTDWRGTPITEGALVIYGAGVGRSIQLVEGTVDGFTPKGSVKVRIVRRSYLSGTQAVVTVGPDRLTIVTSLPETEVPTQEERNAQAHASMVERQRIRDTHDFPPPREEIPAAADRRRRSWPITIWDPCSRCGAERRARDLKDCPA